MTLCLSLPIFIPLCILHVAIMSILAIATCGCFCCLGCGVKVVAEDKDEPSTEGNEKMVFRPFLAVRTILAIILLPVLDLTNQCGIPCCCGLNLPGIERTGTSSDSINEDLSDNESVREV